MSFFSKYKLGVSFQLMSELRVTKRKTTNVT